MIGQKEKLAGRAGHLVAVRMSVCAIVLAAGLAMVGCVQEQGSTASDSSTSASSISVGAESASSVSASASSASSESVSAHSTSASSAPANGAVESAAPDPDAEIADVTTVAYLGPEGTYTEEAALLFFGGNDELMPQATVPEALALVADGSAAYAVVPQENTLGGPVTDYIDAFLASDGLSVVGEVVLPIRQTLMGIPGTDLSQVTRVLSHKQGLAQSAKWLDENLPNAERVEAASTAAAAREVAEGGDAKTVAIAAPGAAGLYELEVLQENVSQSDANKTRFYAVAKSANELPGYNCAVFATSIAAEELPGVLEAVCSNGAKLTCVHDRPEGSALGRYRYVIELEREGGFTDEEVARLEGVGELEFLGRFARVEG